MANPPGNPNQNARSKATGRYVRTPETVARDAEAARLHGLGLTYREIGEQLGYSEHSSVRAAINRAHRDLAEPARPSRDKRAQELDMLWEYAEDILNREHVVVSNGRVIEIDGIPLKDDGPNLAAITELRRINESRRKLDGDDAPSRVSVEAEQLGRDIARLLDNVLGPESSDGDGDDTDA